MSLINEALKKAQPERSGTPPPVPPKHLEMPQVPPSEPPKRKRNYLWGFLMAVVIVALFSALVTTFLVYQILGDEDGTTAPAETAAVEPTETAPAQVWEKLPDEEATSTAVAEVETTAVSLPTGDSRIADEVEELPASEAVATVEESPPAPPAKPNPAVWARLQELEIRGIMSGGEKVLIFDTSTGKTKSYTPGDVLDGSLALSISSIESDAILFEDYGGIIHTKSF
ncbi:MAG: hypothetical protein AB3N64_12610 [Puniceicoccaceae bacterium]